MSCQRNICKVSAVAFLSANELNGWIRKKKKKKKKKTKHSTIKH
jgi:hypothetical protein